MNNSTALILSFALVFAVIGMSELLVRLFNLPKEESRKFVHIGVSNWWLLAMYSFDSWQWAIIPPIAFIILNLVSWASGLFDSMERKIRDINNLGTVYFPISLLIIVLLTWHDSPVFAGASPYIGGLGIMAMGYGDGFAALVGTRSGKNKYTVFGAQKSIEGSITMFICSLVVIFLLLHFPGNQTLPMALVAGLGLALIATLIEAITPKGLDNITVPMVVSLLWLLLAL